MPRTSRPAAERDVSGRAPMRRSPRAHRPARRRRRFRMPGGEPKAAEQLRRKGARRRRPAAPIRGPDGEPGNRPRRSAGRSDEAASRAIARSGGDAAQKPHAGTQQSAPAATIAAQPRSDRDSRPATKRAETMLADKDRIFTNLYGLHDPGLKGARSRGAWDGTKAILEKGRDCDRRRDEEIRPARPGRGGLPDRPQMVVHAKAVGRPAALSRRQRRRIGARHLQGPRDHAARPASPRRGLPASPPSPWAPTPASSTCAANISASARRCRRAVDEAYEASLIGKDNVHGWDFDLIVTHGAGAYICGEETALLESLEGKKGMPRLKPPFPGQYGPLRLPHDRQQRRVRSPSRRTSCAAAPAGSRASAGRTISAQSSSTSPAT